MDDRDEFDRLRDAPVPAPREAARAKALATAMSAFDEKIETAPQGSVRPARLTDRAIGLWRGMMSRKMMATPAIATLVALPLAGYTAFYLIEQQLTPEDEELTPTMKLKRSFVNKKYKEEIDAMYRPQAA